MWKPRQTEKPNNKGHKELTRYIAKNPLGPSGRNNRSQAQQINKWVLKRQAGSREPGKKEIASHGQSMRLKSKKGSPQAQGNCKLRE